MALNLSPGDPVLVTNYPSPRPARILGRCHRAPRRWIVIMEGTGAVQTVRERDLEKRKVDLGEKHETD